MTQKHHWSASIADVSLVRQEAAARALMAAQTLRTELERGAQTEGAAFVDRADREVYDVAHTFNRRVSEPMLTHFRRPSGIVSIRNRDDGAYVLFAFDFNTVDDNQPAVTVRIRQAGRDSVQPFLFVAHGERLYVQCDGAVMNPEQFVRAQLEPWLIGLPISKR